MFYLLAYKLAYLLTGHHCWFVKHDSNRWVVLRFPVIIIGFKEKSI